ncbi:MAG: tetratricopeptide repeat protein [Bacteroidota bacterium]
MKRVFVILFVAMIFADASAMTDSLFQMANDHYQKGEYELALEEYKGIGNAGYESPGLYYNMGNAAFRSNSFGYAILYYEKCLKLDPSHEDARHNLDFVSRYRVDTFEQVPELFLRTWLQALTQSLSERTWSILSIILFMIFLGSILIYLFSRRLWFKKAGFFIALFGLLLFVVTILSALSSHHNIIRPEEGVILSPSVVVRSSPSNTGTELFILHEGTKVKVKEGVSGWQNIRVIDGREGWIGSADFESI